MNGNYWNADEKLESSLEGAAAVRPLPFLPDDSQISPKGLMRRLTSVRERRRQLWGRYE